MPTVNVSVQFNIAMVLAGVAGEIFCQLWHSEAVPWGHYGERFIISSILANIGLAVMLQTIIRRYWYVNKIQDAVQMALSLALLYSCLEGPYDVWGIPTLWRFLFNICHKFSLILVITMVLHTCKKMNKFQ